MKKLFTLCSFFALASLAASAQDDATESNKVAVHGSIQSDILIPQEDKKIGAEDYDDWGLTNTYLDLGLYSKYIDAGGRFEFMEYPLPGLNLNLRVGVYRISM